MGFTKILVAIDKSNLCGFVLAQALELAKANEAALMLFTCITNDTLNQSIVPIPAELGLYPEVMTTAYEVQQIQTQRQIEEIQTWLQNCSQTAATAGVTAELNYKVGEPGRSLCAVAKSWGADLIVMGRRGRRGLTEAMLGSVSNYVLHNASCSVLVIQSVGTQPVDSATVAQS